MITIDLNKSVVIFYRKQSRDICIYIYIHIWSSDVQ